MERPNLYGFYDAITDLLKPKYGSTTKVLVDELKKQEKFIVDNPHWWPEGFVDFRCGVMEVAINLLCE